MVDTSCCLRCHIDNLKYLIYEGRSYIKYERGKMVFWYSSVPYWVIQWQPEDGLGSYLLVNGAGEYVVAAPNEVTQYPLNLQED